MPLDRRMLVGMAGLAGLAALASGAGPLNPPAGPIASTTKPLGEVEPRTVVNAANTPGNAAAVFRITQPGSYYLTANISAPTGRSAIEIAANAVTLDLNGFQLLGTLSGTAPGITANGRAGITIRNGAVVDFGGDGIALTACGACLVESIASTGSFGTGIAVGAQSLVRQCTVLSCPGGGIRAGISSVVRQCSVAFTGGTGIETGGTSVIESCAVTNAATGIVTFAGTVVGCSVSVCTGYGLSIGGNSRVTDCTCTGAGFAGIYGLRGCIVSGCTVVSCDLFGINLQGGSIIEGCVVKDNHGGIRVGSGSAVRRCWAETNGGGSGPTGAQPSILVEGFNCRIEDNTCCIGAVGLRVDAAGCFIARNLCTDHATNWSINAGNACLVVSAAGSAAITGNSGGTSAGSTDPNANYTY